MKPFKTLVIATSLTLSTTLSFAGQPKNCGNLPWHKSWQQYVDKYKGEVGARVIGAMAAQKLVSPNVDKSRVAKQWILSGDAYKVCVIGNGNNAREVFISAKLILAVPSGFSKTEELEIYAIDYGFKENLKQQTFTPNADIKAINVTEVYLTSLQSEQLHTLLVK